jgi:adenylate cyclase
LAQIEAYGLLPRGPITSKNTDGSGEKAVGAERVTRRLAAIVAADVAGYSRLIAADEEGTYLALRRHRTDLIDPKIKEFGGRIANTAGDSLLVEFPSVVDALRCSLDIQAGMRERNQEVPPVQRIEYRIGVNLGDVIEADGDLLGDGVNVAARLENLAEPGGVCLSRAARDQVQDRLVISLKDLGEIKVKNIPRPVRAFCVRGDQDAGDRAGLSDRTPGAQAHRPSIAVLPFASLSSDPEQEFLADGMTEDIIAGLSKFNWLFVIARRSTLAYKSQARDVREIARDLRVRYVLEGSIRRAQNRIRVTVDLVDAETGNHILSKKFDRLLEDIFTVQDEVSDAITSAIAPEISRAEILRARRTPPGDLDAWGQYQKAMSFYLAGQECDHRTAIEFFDRAREMDPEFVDAVAMASLARSRFVYQYAPDDRDELVEEARQILQVAVGLDHSNTTCKCAAGRLHIVLGNYEQALSASRDALAANPNSVMSHVENTMALHALGRWEEALKGWERIIQLSPRDQYMAGIYAGRSHCLFLVGRYEECVDVARKALMSANRRYIIDAILVAALAKLDRWDELESAKEALLAIKPDFTISSLAKSSALWPVSIVAALRKAGLPE